MTIREKLIAGYASMALIVAAVGALSIVVNDRIHRDVRAINEHAYAEVKAATEISAATQTLQVRLGSLFAARTAAQMGDEQARFEAQQARGPIEAALADLKKRVADAEALARQHQDEDEDGRAAEQSELAIVAAFSAEVDRAAVEIRELDVMFDANVPVGTQRGVKDSLRSRLNSGPGLSLQKHAEAEMAKSVANVERTTRTADLVEVVAVCLAVIAGTVLAVVVGRSISRPIEVLRDAAV